MQALHPKNINLMSTQFPSSPIGSSSLSSSSSGESINASNQEDKKKKKRKIKKKTNKQGLKIPTTASHVGGNQPVTVNHVGSVDEIDKTTKITRKPKFPCRICKGDHLLKNCLGIPKVLEVWSTGSQQRVSPTVTSHVGDIPSTSESKVGNKKGKVKFPYRLCEISHQTYLFPRVDEVSYLLENIAYVQQQLPTTYHKFSSNSPLIDELVNLVPSSVNLVDQLIDSIPSSVNHRSIPVFL
jgi:hypothetical protein